ncbi:MAG TPA: cytochrome b/b6 domain-containing protein [Acidobacteriaceae bacterium]|nr:cytochrome b/b6 domain-containing protein [Acidobacteriaceae bacterium]
MATVAPRLETKAPRHTALVRVTHWLTVISFLALLVTGCEILVSHPRFYWGEVGNDLTRPLFIIPIPASRDMVPTGYHVVLPDENGWSRYLHFEAAWVLVLTAFVYGLAGLFSGHFRRDLFPERGNRSLRAHWERLAKYLRRAPPDDAEARSYNVLQRTAYVVVIFILFPMIIWTGLAMSPSFTSAFPATASLLGGRQSARTLHFFLTGLLVLFLVVHVTMIAMSGFRSRMRAMIAGRAAAPRERP